jgi:hypothetical protein
MSSRFVRGWKVSTARLQGLVGAGELSAIAVLSSKVNKRCLREVFVTLGEGEEREEVAEGRAMATEALCDLLQGKPKPGKAYEYARVTELILNHGARPLAATLSQEILLGHSYHVPNDDFGRWNPLLRACGMPQLARIWARNNFLFPWKSGKARVDWPSWTVIGPTALPGIAKELDLVKVDDLKRAADREWSDEEAYVEASRKELWQGLQRLRKWVNVAMEPEDDPPMCCDKTGNALVLSMDGDQ